MPTEQSRIEQLLKARAEVEQELGRLQADVSVLFTDVVGSTAYFEKRGDIAGLAMVTRYADLANDVSREQGGRPVKTIGDAIMAEFSDAAAAVRAGVEIQRRLLRLNATLAQQDRMQLRVGIHLGKCFRDRDDLYGEGVNVAARVIKGCGPAQILISQSVKNALPASFECRSNPLGEIELRKGGEKEQVHEVVWMETQAYVELRHDATVALKRGDLVAPGVHFEDLVQQAPPALTQRTPAVAHMTPAVDAPIDSIPLPSGATPVPVASLAARYEVLGELGAGGMGVVYKAKDRETGDFVALKVLRPEIAADAEGMARFKHELRVTRRITHKNVCRIHEFSRTENSAYISMELVEGESLRQILTRFGSMAPKKGVQIATQICAGLHEAHSQGVIHRDLKPENVMIDQAGNVKLMDFGIARSNLGHATAAGLVIGTPAYMAPEQVQGKNVDQRSDIYSLGLILYEIFTGTPAFRGKTAVELVFKQIQETATAPRQLEPTLPLHIELTIIRCLEKDPDARFQSVSELEAALAGRIEQPTAQVAVPTPSSLPTAGTVVAAAAAVSTPTPQPAAPAASISASAPHAPPVGASDLSAALPQAAPVRPSPTMSTGVLIGAALLVLVIGGVFAVKYFTGSKSSDQSQPPIAENKQKTGENSQPPAPNPPDSSASTTPPGDHTGAASGGTTPAPPTPDTSKTSAKGTPGGSTASPPPKPVPEPAPAPAPVRPLPDYSFSRTLAGHTAGVAAVAFSGDGRLVITGSMDKTARVWEAGSGQQLAVLKGHGNAVTAVALSPDGSIAVTGSLDRLLKLWDASSGHEAMSLPKESSGYLALAFSPDGRVLAAAMQDGRVKLFDMPSVRVVQTLDAHSGPVHALAFSPDGRVLATAGRDQKIKLWNVAAAQEIATLAGHSDAVMSVAFSSDGRMLASGSEDKTVKLWDLGARRELRTLTGHTEGVDGVAFSADGRVLASASGDKTVKLWEVSSGRELKTLTGHVFGISALIASRDGRWFASAAGDKTVRLWRRE